ncbi:hypothetical protein HA466_0041950 [Hirschfeldia incana]|nr:hypothetical protein HA466_0041950 [Hirschfeldia incana]
MIYLQSSITVVEPSPIMSNHHHFKPKTTRKSSLPSPSSSLSTTFCCDGAQSAAVDVLFLIAVITSSAILIFPYIRFITLKSISIISDVSFFIKQEIVLRNPDPIVYGLITWSVTCTVLTGLMIVLILCGSGSRRRCRKPNCRGLGRADGEFDVRLESEDGRVERLKSGVVGKMGLFELRRDRRGLEAELKKMAPENGRAVLVYRGKCGCSVGRLVVPGAKKVLQERKIKK